jgi:hypothetical protein
MGRTTTSNPICEEGDSQQTLVSAILKFHEYCEGYPGGDISLKMCSVQEAPFTLTLHGLWLSGTSKPGMRTVYFLISLLAPNVQCSMGHFKTSILRLLLVQPGFSFGSTPLIIT